MLRRLCENVSRFRSPHCLGFGKKSCTADSRRSHGAGSRLPSQNLVDMLISPEAERNARPPLRDGLPMRCCPPLRDDLPPCHQVIHSGWSTTLVCLQPLTEVDL